MKYNKVFKIISIVSIILEIIFLVIGVGGIENIGDLIILIMTSVVDLGLLQFYLPQLLIIFSSCTDNGVIILDIFALVLNILLSPWVFCINLFFTLGSESNNLVFGVVINFVLFIVVDIIKLIFDIKNKR